MKAFHEVRNYPSDFMVSARAYRNIRSFAHWHREIELVYVRSGSALFHIGEETFTAPAGSLVLCAGGEVHFIENHSENTALEFLIFDPGIISSSYQPLAFSRRLLNPSELAALRLDTQWQLLFPLICSELEERGKYYQELITSLIRSYWYLLLRNLNTGQGKSAHSAGSQQHMLDKIQTILDFMEDHYDSSITLQDCAEITGFSPSHFSHLFHQATGTGFVRYLNTIRVSHAADLILVSGDKLIDIAEQCGFSSVRTFNRVFLEITGTTPSEYSRNPGSHLLNFTYYKAPSEKLLLPEKNPTLNTQSLDSISFR